MEIRASVAGARDRRGLCEGGQGCEGENREEYDHTKTSSRLFAMLYGDFLGLDPRTCLREGSFRMTEEKKHSRVKLENDSRDVCAHR
jgi:hypothetical protein